MRQSASFASVASGGYYADAIQSTVSEALGSWAGAMQDSGPGRNSVEQATRRPVHEVLLIRTSSPQERFLVAPEDGILFSVALQAVLNLTTLHVPTCQLEYRNSSAYPGTSRSVLVPHDRRESVYRRAAGGL